MKWVDASGFPVEPGELMWDYLEVPSDGHTCRGESAGMECSTCPALPDITDKEFRALLCGEHIGKTCGELMFEVD